MIEISRQPRCEVFTKRREASSFKDDCWAVDDALALTFTLFTLKTFVATARPPERREDTSPSRRQAPNLQQMSARWRFQSERPLARDTLVPFQNRN